MMQPGQVRRFMVGRFAVVLTIPFLGAPASAADPPWIARSAIGMVASDSPEASQIGARVLAEGGNAFDAAVATSLALAVSRPQSTGLGGGGFMVGYSAAERKFVVLDFREVAPAAATAEHYARVMAAAVEADSVPAASLPASVPAARDAGLQSPARPSPAIYGGNAIGVPGQIAGLKLINERFGTRRLAELIAPARRLAVDGFTADEAFRDACADALADYARWPEFRGRFPELYRTLLGAGTPPAIGSKVRRPELATAFQVLAEQGPDAFYRGPLGEAAVEAARAAGGVLTRADLAAYRVRERAPLRGQYRDFEIVTMPPPSSGGVCLLEMLNILQLLGIRSDLGPVEDQPHLLIESMKHAFADRARWLGDPDFAHPPVERLVSAAHAAGLAQRIQPGRTLRIEEYGLVDDVRPAAGAPRERGTSHFCVADRAGNIVAMTETINGTFGSYVIAEPFGILLNNQMDDFATEPGKPNLFGLVQGAANAVEPGKRPLSSMTPTIVLRDGRPMLALGASGGPRIITSVLQVLRNVADGGMSLEEALQALRLHHQWLPNEVAFDRDAPAETKAALTRSGHALSSRRQTGVVQAILWLPDGTLVGGSDPRKDGRPAGVPGQ